jgi:hypothetical protein
VKYGWYNIEIQEGFSFQSSVLPFENTSNILEVFWDRPQGRRMYWQNLPYSHRSRVVLYLLPTSTQIGLGSLDLHDASQGLVLRCAKPNSLEFVRLGMFYAHYEGVKKSMRHQILRYPSRICGARSRSRCQGQDRIHNHPNLNLQTRMAFESLSFCYFQA